METNTKKEETKQKDDYDESWLKGTSAEMLITNKKSNKNKKQHSNNTKTNSKEKYDFSNPVYKKISKINGKINDMSINDLTKSLNELNLDSSGKKEILIKRLKTYHKENCLKNENLDEQEPKCRFDYVCVIDYEATCSDNQSKTYPHEIIEFPIVLINMKTLTIEDHFSSYCRPVINSKLSKFCTELTGITQDQVNVADEFPVVLDRVREWFKSHELGTKYKFAIATDGPWDMQNFLNLQCFHSKIDYPRWAKKWIDVRKLFSNWFGVRRCNIIRMLDYCGWQFEGKQHCGLDDARNIARILIRLAKDGCEIKINDNIKKCMSEFEKNTQEEEDEVNQENVLNESNSDDSLEFAEE